MGRGREREKEYGDKMREAETERERERETERGRERDRERQTDRERQGICDWCHRGGSTHRDWRCCFQRLLSRERSEDSLRMEHFS
jgi:hypothetical protein